MLPTGRPNWPVGAKFKTNYLDIPNEPLFPFGYGLSYTTFEYGDLRLSGETVTSSSGITASIDITNTGDRSGKEVVQLYIRDLVGSISRPVKELKGFQKIELNPGEKKTVEFNITEELLRFYNGDIEYISEPGDFTLFVGPNSEDVKSVGFSLAK
jgi:beta-glucosidase